MAGLETNSEYGETAQAVSLGLAVLRKCKQNSWDGLVAAMAADDVNVIKAFQALDLDESQLDLMSRRQPEISLIRISPAVVPAICPACGMFILTSDAAPAKCQVTAGCEGKPAKVAAAKATKAPAKPVEESPVALAVAEAVETFTGVVADIVETAVAEANKPSSPADDSFDFEPDEPAVTTTEALSLEDLAEDFTEAAPAPAATRSSRIVLDDDNGFD